MFYTSNHSWWKEKFWMVFLKEQKKFGLKLNRHEMYKSLIEVPFRYETIFGNWRFLKNDEKYFLCHLKKLLSVSKYLDFYLEFLFMWKTGLIRKIRLVSKFRAPQPGKQTIARHIFHDISRGKGNQTMRFGHLTLETFFFKNRTQNESEKLFSDPCLENQKWAYLWINSLKFYIVCFHCLPKWGLWKHTDTKLQTTYFYLK